VNINLTDHKIDSQKPKLVVNTRLEEGIEEAILLVDRTFTVSVPKKTTSARFKSMLGTTHTAGMTRDGRLSKVRRRDDCR
jgi:hypothetical protein